MKRLAPTALALAFALAACGGDKTEPVATAEPEAASTDYVIENPTEPAVPVDLPSTGVTKTPAAEASPAKSQ